MATFQHDAFISHASEDKDDFVRPLACELQKYGLNVWFDEFSLSVGDSLRESIEHGLACSRFGIVVFSHQFFRKKWPPAELNGLFARERGGRGKVILPVWHNISREDMLNYAPIQADKVAANSAEGVQGTAKKLVAMIRPEALILDNSKDDLTRTSQRLREQFGEQYPGYDIQIVSGALGDEPNIPGLLASQWQNGLRIDVLVKDPTKIQTKPGFRMTLSGAGVTKYQEAVRTGRAQKLFASEVSDFQTTVPLAEKIAAGGSLTELHLLPKIPQGQSILTRVTFGDSPDQVTFPVVEFKGVRAGTDEVEIAGTRKGLAFSIHLTVPLGSSSSGKATLRSDLLGKDFREIQWFLRGISALQENGNITITDLERELTMFQGFIALQSADERSKAIQAFVDDVVAVEDFYNVSLAWPSAFADDDFEALEILKCLKDNTALEGGVTLTGVTTKTGCPERDEIVADGFKGGLISLWVEPKERSVFGLFGKEVFSGLIRITAERAEVLNRDTVMAGFLQASSGETVDFQIQTLSPVQFRVVTPGEAPPTS